jgi:hypothetical protein
MRRNDLSLTQAAKRAHANPRTVRKYLGAAVERRGRRFLPAKTDQLPRELAYLGPKGPEWVTVRDSESATLLGEHASAVNRYLTRGDEDALKPFDGKSVKVGRRRLPLLTDLATIDRLAEGGELHYELYRR